MDALRIGGLVSLFLGGAMIFTNLFEENRIHFPLQLIFGPALIYFGFKLLL